MLKWLRAVFVPSRVYRVWIYVEHRWVPAGIVRAGSYAAAKAMADRQQRGYQTRVLESE